MTKSTLAALNSDMKIILKFQLQISVTLLIHKSLDIQGGKFYHCLQSISKIRHSNTKFLSLIFDE